MTKLIQCYTLADHGRGDCWRTAIACLLDKTSPQEVPDFKYTAQGGLNQDWWASSWTWLRGQGYDLDHWPLSAEKPAPDYPHIITGRSPRKRLNGEAIYHALLASGTTVLHDPHPEGGGLETYTDVYTVLRR